MAWHIETITISGFETEFEEGIEAEFEVSVSPGTPITCDDPGSDPEAHVTAVKAKVGADVWAKFGREHWVERMIWDALQEHVNDNIEGYIQGGDQ